LLYFGQKVVIDFDRFVALLTQGLKDGIDAVIRL